MTARSSDWRITLASASERLHGPEQAAIQRLGAEIEHALDEVRGAASGTPPALRQHGVATALRALAHSAADHGARDGAQLRALV